jgi:hypothetical protein
MKTIGSALVALAVLVGVAASVAPASADTLAERLERDGRFGHSI